MAGALNTMTAMMYQQPPPEVKRSCGVFGWMAESYTCPTDGSMPTEKGYICGSYGIMNQTATPLQVAMYCKYQNLVQASQLNAMWPVNLTNYHCSTENVECYKAPHLVCPPGSVTRNISTGTYCCKPGPVDETTTCTPVS